MKISVLALFLLLLLGSTAAAQSSISLSGGPYVGPSLGADRDPILSAEFSFDLGLTDPGFQFGHIDLVFGGDSLPMVFGGFQWVCHPDPTRVGFWLGASAGSLVNSDFDLGTEGFLFRITVGVIIDWVVLGWHHWSHGYTQGQYNPGLDQFFIGFRFEFGGT